jgi:hypothetical protein
VVLSEQFLARVAADPAERGVDVDDASRGIGDGNAEVLLDRSKQGRSLAQGIPGPGLGVGRFHGQLSGPGQRPGPVAPEGPDHHRQQRAQEHPGQPDQFGRRAVYGGDLERGGRAEHQRPVAAADGEGHHVVKHPPAIARFGDLAARHRGPGVKAEQMVCGGQLPPVEDVDPELVVVLAVGVLVAVPFAVHHVGEELLDYDRM